MWVSSNDQKKTKLKEEAISEILVADSDLESGGEASEFEDYFEVGGGSGTTTTTTTNMPQQKSKHRLQQVVDYQPGDRLKEGTQIFILLSVQQKV